MPFPININDDCLMTTKKTMTTNAGTPVAENQNVQTAGPHGPMLMQNVWYMEKLAHFTRERIPERVVHAKGSAAYGTFTVTKDITKYTKASIYPGSAQISRFYPHAEARPENQPAQRNGGVGFLESLSGDPPSGDDPDERPRDSGEPASDARLRKPYVQLYQCGE